MIESELIGEPVDQRFERRCRRDVLDVRFDGVADNLAVASEFVTTVSLGDEFSTFERGNNPVSSRSRNLKCFGEVPFVEDTASERLECRVSSHELEVCLRIGLTGHGKITTAGDVRPFNIVCGYTHRPNSVQKVNTIQGVRCYAFSLDTLK